MWLRALGLFSQVASTAGKQKADVCPTVLKLVSLMHLLSWTSQALPHIIWKAKVHPATPLRHAEPELGLYLLDFQPCSSLGVAKNILPRMSLSLDPTYLVGGAL